MPPRKPGQHRKRYCDIRPIGAAARLVSTVNATGGVVQYPDGTIAPVGEPEWTDLGDAYMAACTELGIEPQLTKGTLV